MSCSGEHFMRISHICSSCFACLEAVIAPIGDPAVPCGILRHLGSLSEPELLTPPMSG